MGISGDLGQVRLGGALPDVVGTTPSFSLQAITSITPVVVVLVTLQASVPSVVHLRSEGYDPTERSIAVLSGLGTVFASVLGPTASSMSLPLAA